MFWLKNVADKYQMMRVISKGKFYLLVAPFLIFAACGNNHKTANENGNRDSSGKAANTHILGSLLNNYLALSDALSKDNSELASEESEKLFQAAKQLSMTKNKPGSDSLWKVILPEIIEDAEHIEKNEDDIGHQRMHFTSVSSCIIQLIEDLGSPITLYKVNCPMYDKESGGANWLSKKKEFQNPYLGSKTNSCGVVKKSIQPK